MIELLVRLIYFAVVLGLYFVGLRLSPPQAAEQASQLDFKLLLPLLSVVFLEFFVRKFSPFYHSVYIENVRVEQEAMCLEFSLLHRGIDPIHYSYGGLSWVKSDILSLDCRFSDNEEQHYNVPERFATALNREKNVVVLTLQSNPGTPLKKICSFHGRHLFLAVLWIKVNRISLPHFFLIKRTEGR